MNDRIGMSENERARKILFTQLRHVYAPKSREGHVHLSAPLITVMSQIHQAANGVIEMTYMDENFESERGNIEADIVAVNLLGAPYIYEAIKVIERVSPGCLVILGGQIIDSLSREFDELFSGVRSDVRVINGNDLRVLSEELGIGLIPEKETVSSIPIWEQIEDEQMEKYLRHGMSFYLSQGCKYHCTFCQAQKGRPEVYRNLDLAKADLEWLTKKAMSFGINELDIYFSNLDIFQTEEKLEAFLDSILEIKKRHPKFVYQLRGLATVDSMNKVSEGVLEKAKEAGFISIGLGADGATAAVWLKTGKVHNLSDNEKDEAHKCIKAIERCHKSGITPEVLMVFGHDTGNFEESKEDLEAALSFMQDMMEQFGAIPRPHVVKTVPGSVEWKRKKKNGEIINLLVSNPEYFQALDYTALPSEISHPDKHFRDLVADYYRRACALDPENSTKIIYPKTPLTLKWAQKVGVNLDELNEEKYDR